VGRPQFWYFILANIIASLAAAIVGGALSLPLVEIYNLATLLPVAAIGVRRLHDIGRDGKLIWIFIITGFIFQLILLLTMASFFFLGFFSFLLFGPELILIKLAFLVICVVLIYYWCQPGDPASNAYGPPPPVFDPSPRAAP
jgi:uncharacterized membrane protein YhaH (DUF805 family)